MMVYWRRCTLLVLLLGWVLFFRPVLGATGQLDEQQRQKLLEEAKQLNAQVEKMKKEGQYGQAVPLAEKALAIMKEALGPRHLDVAKSLNELGFLYRAMGLYPKAVPFQQEALAIQQEALGLRHPDVAKSQ